MAKSHPFYSDPDFWRPQAYLQLVALLCVFLLGVLPLFEARMETSRADVFVQGIVERPVESGCLPAEVKSSVAPPLTVISSVLFLELLLGLAVYRNRRMQMYLLLGTALLWGFLVGLGYWMTHSALGDAARGNAACAAKISPDWGCAAGAIGIVLCLLAAKRSRDDHRQLKRADRFW